MMQFEPGKRYSRRKISAALGGSLRSFLPVKDGSVVCGCFKLDPRYNPRAPREVTIGPSPKAFAEMMSRQTDPIPVFLFRASAAWEYVGLYRCTGYSTDPDLLERKMQENPERGPIAGVLYFESVADQVIASEVVLTA